MGIACSFGTPSCRIAWRSRDEHVEQRGASFSGGSSGIWLLGIGSEMKSFVRIFRRCLCEQNMGRLRPSKGTLLVPVLLSVYDINDFAKKVTLNPRGRYHSP